MLGTLAASVAEARLDGPEDVDVLDVTHDSRRVSPGSLFVAVRGSSDDGNAYVDQALSRGAVAGPAWCWPGRTSWS